MSGRDEEPGNASGEAHRRPAIVIPAEEALERLREGNRRFVASTPNRQTLSWKTRRAELVNGQAPFAVIFGCSDSRAPAELIFDQGLGDLFVIRVAGNIVAPSLVGSVEFAATNFGTRLVVVLGHTQCGAIFATLDELRRPAENQSPNLRSIVNRVRPSVEALLSERGHDDQQDTAEFVRKAVRLNVRASVQQLQHGSEILEQLIARRELSVVGAEYSLETGEVDFFDGML
jgi:carbonic anhydrase